MNRDIKFRAWNSLAKKMLHFGNPLGIMDGTDRYGMFMESLEGKMYCGGNYELMQFTGLNDKSGKEIYEGDIVNMHYFFENHDRETLGAFEDEAEVVGVVRIDEMSVYTDCKERRFDWVNYLEEPTEELEVIGNIYANPELLEGESHG